MKLEDTIHEKKLCKFKHNFRAYESFWPCISALYGKQRVQMAFTTLDLYMKVSFMIAVQQRRKAYVQCR